MIEYVKGDLFAEHHPIIAHGCNAQGVMGSGVAKIIKEKWPGCYEKYKESLTLACKESNLGKVIPYISTNVVILNCITQLDYGKDGERYVSYDAIDNCMFYINHQMQFNNILGEYLKPDNSVYIAMPKIGAGLGGGNWNVIKSIINHRLQNIKVKVYEL